MSSQISKNLSIFILGEFVNGDTLFEWLEKNRQGLPDIILSDLNMPGKNGYDILSFINSEPDLGCIPVIITSTSPVIAVREKCLSNGCHGIHGQAGNLH
ncbi:response regulator [Dyadobacter bucti]|uniref:response regulator n=1 Tax=Dyadobacter bucti TaxID=2572203 RepID=UPI00110974B9